MVYGWDTGGIRVVYGRYTGGIRVVYGWYTGGIRAVYGGIRVVYGRYTAVYGGIRVVYGRYTAVYGGIRGRYTAVYGGIRVVYGRYTGGIRVVYGCQSYLMGVPNTVLCTMHFLSCGFTLPKYFWNYVFDHFCKYHDGRGFGKKWCLFDHLGDRKRITSWWHMNWHNLWKQTVRWWWLLCISFEFLWVLCSCQHWPT